MRKFRMTKGGVQVLVAAMVLGVSSVSCAADDTKALKQEISKLNQRIVQLEQQLEQKNNIDSIDAWDPFMQMDHMQQRMFNMINRAEFFNPRIDIKETKNQYTITMDIPGMDKDKIDISVKENNLIISGERSSSKEEKSQDRFYRQERSFGHFVRALPLPKDADTASVEAAYDKGVLTIHVKRLEKVPAAAPQKIVVK